MYNVRKAAFLLIFALASFASTVRAHADAESEFQAGLVYLQDTTNIDIPSALGRFHAALDLDGTHAGANVFAAVLEFAQMVDDSGIQSLRLSYSNGADSASISQYISRGAGKGEKLDSSVKYRKYVWGTDSKASAAQSVLSRVITDSIPHLESHLIAAENGNGVFDFPKNLIDDAPHGDTIEIDKTEIYAIHSALLVFKAVFVVLTSYNVDLTYDPRMVPDTVSWDTYKDSHPSLLTANSTWSKAWTALSDIDTKLYAGLSYLNSETDSQDSDLIRRITGGLDTTNSRYLNDTANTLAGQWQTDTINRVLGGDSISFDSEAFHAELGKISAVPSLFFADPPNRTDLNDLDPVRHRGLEWNDVTPIDPTLGGILPGMTLNKFFLFAHHPDTYFVIDNDATIDLNDYSTFGSWTQYRPHDAIDIRFAASKSTTVTVKRRTSVSSANFWNLEFVTPASTGHHVRILFDNEDDFVSSETYKIRRPGDFTQPAVRIVPWTVSGGLPVDAGSSASNFSTYFSSVTLKNTWNTYGADTLAMYVLANGDDVFESIPTSTIRQSGETGDTTLLTASATRLGWFLSGAPATGSDSYLIFAFYPSLTGTASTSLESDFYVGVYKIATFTDTAAGYHSDFTYTALPGATVTFSIYSSPSGALGQDLDTESAVTNSYGYATTRLTLGDKAGVYTVRASLAADSGGGDVLMFGITKGVKAWPGAYWLMYSLPRQPTSLVASTIMGASSFSSSEWRFYEYDPATDAVAQPTSLEMGRGYWLKSLEDGYVGVDLNASSELTDSQYLPLDVGWNQIGVPFDKVYKASQLQIQVGAVNPVAFDTAADSGYVTKRFYTYNGSSYTSCPDATFGINTCYFYPFEAQWIYVTKACTLVVAPLPSSSAPSVGAPQITSASYRAPYFSTGRSGVLLTTAPMAPKKYDDWTIQLIAESGKFVDMMNAVGIRPAPPEPVRKAPRAPEGVHLSIRNGRTSYASTFSPPNEKASWDIDVYASSPGIVTVRASNLASVPDGVSLTLTDLAAGVRTDLRKSPSYTYSSGAGEVRAFNLSTDDAGFFTRVIHPAACRISGAFGSHSRLTGAFRALRDMLLGNPLGRVLAQVYYRTPE